MNPGDEPTDPTPDLQDILLDFNFTLTPDWARSAPGVQSDARERKPRDRDDRRGPPRRSGSDQRNNDRPPPRSSHSSRDDRGTSPRRPPPSAPSGEERPRQGDRQNDRDMRQERPQRPPRFPVRVDFLPVRDNLHRIVHIIHRAPQAFPLDELAHKFLSNPDALLLKITPREGVDFPLWQCGAGGEVFTDRAEAESHLIATHMPKVFVPETVKIAPPKGIFQSVGRCRRTGTLLGPPNHHSYAESVENCRRTHFPDWPRDRFMQQVEMVKEPEVIEQWRDQQSTITVFRERPQEIAKLEPTEATPPLAVATQPATDAPETTTSTPDNVSGELPAPHQATDLPTTSDSTAPQETGDASSIESPPLSQKDAEKLYRSKYIPALLSERVKCICPASWLLRDAKTDFAAQVRDTHGRELNNPFSIMLALRPALKHMKCYLFKVSGRTFVSGVAPNPVDPSLCAEELKSILLWVLDHPGGKRRDLLEALHPGKNQETTEAVHLFTQLHWLAEKGHVVQFSDGTLVVPKAQTP